MGPLASRPRHGFAKRIRHYANEARSSLGKTPTLRRTQRPLDPQNHIYSLLTEWVRLQVDHAMASQRGFDIMQMKRVRPLGKHRPSAALKDPSTRKTTYTVCLRNGSACKSTTPWLRKEDSTLC